jgi:hypothetical protein
MRTLPSILFFACLASTAPAESPVPRSAVRAAVPEEFKDQFKPTSEPDTSLASSLPISADQPIVRMNPFIVPAYRELRELPAIFQQQEQSFKARKMWLLNGGVVVLRAGKVFKVELDLNCRVHGNGADLFRISISW